MEKELEIIDASKMDEFCFINGQVGLHETEEAIYKYLVARQCYPLVLDGLFDNPGRIKAIKYFNPKTVILGSTGTYKAKMDKVLWEFKKLNWLPQNAIFTMGEHYFWDIIKLGVIGYKVYPYSHRFEDPPQIVLLNDNDY